jgi:hypothetical protein
MQTLQVALDTPSVTASMHLGVWLAVMLTRPGSLVLKTSSLSAAAAEVTTLPTIVVAVSGKYERRLLKCERRGARPKGWRPHAPASAQISSSRAFSRT